jgi:hypothetical protein
MKNEKQVLELEDPGTREREALERLPSCGIGDPNGDGIVLQDNGGEDGQPLVDVPPDGGYGWVCVACCFWVNSVCSNSKLHRLLYIIADW